MTRMLGMGMGGGEGMEDLPDQLLGKVEGMLEVVRKVRGLTWCGLTHRRVGASGMRGCKCSGESVGCAGGCVQGGGTGVWANTMRGGMSGTKGCWCSGGGAGHAGGNEETGAALWCGLTHMRAGVPGTGRERGVGVAGEGVLKVVRKAADAPWCGVPHMRAGIPSTEGLMRRVWV